MGKKTGNEAILYRNDGTFEAPDWVEVENVKDLTLGIEKGSVDASTRGSIWRQFLTTLKDASIDWQSLWDTEGADFSAFQDAFFDDTQIELAVMDGDITVAGAEGLRVTVDVMGFTRNEPLEDAMSVDVTTKPSAKADNPPAWYVSTT